MKSRISTPVVPHMYSGFVGLNSARSEIALEQPDAQPVIAADNLFCSSSGLLSNEAAIVRLKPTEQEYISHLRLISTTEEKAVYAARNAVGTSLRLNGENGSAENVWPHDARVSSAVFMGVPILAAGDGGPMYYDGHTFREIVSEAVDGARFLCVVQNRLVAAGFSGTRENDLELSRVQNFKRFRTDEDPADATVTKAARIGISAELDESESITGIAPFETGKLAVFTNDRALVYVADPDYTKWAIDRESTVRVGAISHNAIVSVGPEVFYCSRYGVHSLRRSMLNGVNTFTMSLSEDITELYQELLAMVPRVDDVSAYFNQQESRLHIFFPVNERLSYRLSAAISPPREEVAVSAARWSLSAYGGPTCGHYLAGRALMGTISGFYSVKPWSSNDGERGPGTVDFPILWHNDILSPKASHMLVLYASGVGKVSLEFKDESDRQLGPELVFELPDADQADYYGLPLQQQFTRPFQHRYSGLRARLKIHESAKGVRVFAIGVLVKKED